MKKLIIIGYCLFLISCSQPKSRWELINEKEKSELASGIKKDTIFLDFMFGMSEEAVYKRFVQLLDQGKISASNQAFEYKFTFDYPKEAIATFQTKYFNDRLCQLSLGFELSSHVEATIVQLNLVSLFTEKYGTPIKVPSVLVENESDYIFIQGNRKIEIDFPFSSSFLVSYTDIPIDAEKAKLDQRQKDIKDNVTKDDI